MKPLFTQEEFDKANSSKKLPCECYFCSNTFYKEKKFIKNKKDTIKFCSRKCQFNNQIKSIKCSCKQCKKLFTKRLSSIIKTKNNFCSKSCAATYNNTHKTKGYRRSKLEVWLEEQLKILYPNLEIKFNDKTAINSELDIYIPSLNIAFELNGIFHYEPIYGSEKLIQIQNNDNRKFQACLEHNISLCIIDTSKFTYFKPNKAQEYLQIIMNIINAPS